MTGSDTALPATTFGEILARRTPAERRIVARVKRAFELYMADKHLREAIQAEPDRLNELMRAAGADDGLDYEHLRPLFDKQAAEKFSEAPETLPREARLHREWIADLLRHRSLLRDRATESGNPRFAAWQAREMARCGSELPGGTSDAIVHPIVAFELSRGCSVGCWFCGISAETFEGAIAYTPETAALWRGMLEAMRARFGTAASTGFCYWATDPMDNPDYDRFIADFRDITGHLPQTTTAAPLKDTALTRRVMALSDEAASVINRFSIVTPRQLKAVHDTFTPDELLGVELVIQTKESLVGKSQAGRMRDRKAKQADAGRDRKLTEVELDGGTIACVTGFLVNVPEGTLRLISPCAPNDEWPLGYRVYAEGRFRDADEFAALLDEAMDRAMPATPLAGAPLGFRRDLAHTPVADDRFELANRWRTHTVQGPAFMGRLGERLAAGGAAGDIVADLVAEGADIFAVSQALQDLFDSGYVEHPVTPTVLGRAGRKPQDDLLEEAG